MTKEEREAFKSLVRKSYLTNGRDKDTLQKQFATFSYEDMDAIYSDLYQVDVCTRYSDFCHDLFCVIIGKEAGKRLDFSDPDLLTGLKLEIVDPKDLDEN